MRTPSSAHIPALDGVRGIAVILVATHNLRLITDPTSAASVPWVEILDRGWLGVQLFFVLSAFLITRILRETDNADNHYFAFYARRALRILPLYYLTLLVWLVLLPAIGLGYPHNRHDDWSLWVFLSNYTHPQSLTHFWSLAVEEQFYLFWPLLLHRRTAQWAIGLCCGLAMGSLATRFIMLMMGWSWEAVYTFTPSRLDALALGAMAAMWTYKRPPKWIAWAVFVLGAAFSRGYRQSGPLAQTLGYTCAAIAFALWIGQIAITKRPAWLEWPWLRKFGKYSYGIYVIHVPLKELVAVPLFHRLGFSGTPSLGVDILFVTISLLVTYLLAMGSYHLFEVHFLRLKRYFEPSTSINQNPSQAQIQTQMP